jgi:hypothetical protein
MSAPTQIQHPIARRETRNEAMNALMRAVYEIQSGRLKLPADELKEWERNQYRLLKIIRALDDLEQPA